MYQQSQPWSAMVYNGLQYSLQWFAKVHDVLQWFTMVYQWFAMMYDGLQWFTNGLRWFTI